MLRRKPQAAGAAAKNNKIFLVPLHLMSCLQFFILQSKNHQDLVVVPLEITLSCPMCSQEDRAILVY
ncbi:hypothetical protein F2Q69_00014983 [Brassica cretica]|uniref:Uncharacterized protein n=1 Tax=Brassica cretica TaxID=69181 RepID=A0A8S9QPH7_BRACR|nr:hypothetical protein F2Q69_00014983 [Brassica cretica]